MAVFRGSKNVQLGGPDPWASASYDDTDRSYVIEVDGEDADLFRTVAAEYGFTEVDATAAPAAAESAPVSEQAPEQEAAPEPESAPVPEVAGDPETPEAIAQPSDG